jgi:hypothetical protein
MKNSQTLWQVDDLNLSKELYKKKSLVSLQKTVLLWMKCDTKAICMLYFRVRNDWLSESLPTMGML